ncbi:hypothetical protein ONE63_005185 [Megalurothrips usitatus]|uniref:Uncharacterized protein n=1 Tax=Megalurothrips usitatus TaxID=439358 RepID=A0AAV7Y0V6_9NEOP|nr:hypothetical protein ONE63_005185 [Megalurothrips usitatus]
MPWTIGASGIDPRTQVETGDKILCFTISGCCFERDPSDKGENKEQEELECSIVYEEILVNTPERPSLFKEFEEAKQEQEKPGETVTIAKEDSEVENSSYILEPESSERSLNNNSVEECQGTRGRIKKSDEATTQELNKIIVEKLVFAMPMSIYREMEKKKDDLTPLSVIPQAMTLIRDSPDEKKCMKIMNGSVKSSDSEDSESDEEEEEHAEAKKKEKHTKKLLKEWTRKSEAAPKVEQDTAKKEAHDERMAALEKQLAQLSVNLVQWQEGQQKEEVKEKQGEKPAQPNYNQYQGGGNRGGGYRGGYRGRGGYHYQSQNHQGSYQNNFQQPFGQAHSPQQPFHNYSQMGYMPQQQQPPQQRATMSYAQAQPQMTQQNPQQGQQFNPQRGRKRCYTCGSTWHLQYNRNRQSKN